MYRTQTYIAGDWTGDSDLINKLIEWNKSDHYNLHFSDVHNKIQSRDTSLYCSIKKSLATRLDMSKTFVLIVGQKTDLLTKGSCQYCSKYISYLAKCNAGGYIDYRSYIEFECQKAKRDGLKIVVIYNYLNIHREKCPECLRYVGTHIPAYYRAVDGKEYWNYSAIKSAING